MFRLFHFLFTVFRHVSRAFGPSLAAEENSFVALTLHVATHSPAPGARLASKGKVPGISRVPRGPGEGEHCTCVILVPEDSDDMNNSEKEGEVGGKWAMVESVGRWDARFG